MPAAIRTLDAAGWPTVIIETVGVGQSEVEIAATADTTIVVVNPGWGDEIQANKAGLLEIADVFIVNKSDRPGAARTVSDLERMLHLGGPRARTPPVVQTIATTQGGIDALCQSIFEHRTYLHESAELDRRRGARRVNEAVDRARTELMAALELACNSPAGRRTLSEVRDGSSDPVQASIELVELVAVSDDSTR